MAIREFDETFQITETAGTVEVMYTGPAGEVASIQKLTAINTDTTATCVLNVWLDPDGGSSASDGDKNHLVVDEPLVAKQRLNIAAAGRKIPPAGQILAEVSLAGGGNFQSACNIHVSGVLIAQNRAATGTSA